MPHSRPIPPKAGPNGNGNGCRPALEEVGNYHHNPRPREEDPNYNGRFVQMTIPYPPHHHTGPPPLPAPPTSGHMGYAAYGQRPMAQSMPPPPGYSGGRNDPLGHHSAQQSLYFAGQNFDPGNAGLHERPHQPYHVPMYPIVRHEAPPPHPSFRPMVHGQHETKRVRRRPEEIDRIYKCGWNDCPKGYGTLNHLNAHVTMQNHGPKRTPDQFKEIRREWKARKKEEERLRQQEITDNEKAERSRGG
ncbi:hypothetical protein PG987_014556 [Apiospora arundinis]